MGTQAVLAQVRTEPAPQLGCLFRRERRLGYLRFRELFPRRDRLFAGRPELGLQAHYRAYHPVEHGAADQRPAHWHRGTPQAADWRGALGSTDQAWPPLPEPGPTRFPARPSSGRPGLGGPGGAALIPLFPDSSC
jgi:hypothetical protein